VDNLVIGWLFYSIFTNYIGLMNAEREKIDAEREKIYTAKRVRIYHILEKEEDTKSDKGVDITKKDENTVVEVTIRTEDGHIPQIIVIHLENTDEILMNKC